MLHYERIYYKQMLEALHSIDRRTVKNFCRHNNVRLFCNKGSNRIYTLKEEFLHALNAEAVQYMNEKYEQFTSPETIKAGMRFFKEYTEAVETTARKHSINTDYKPQGEYEKRFLDELKKL